MSDTTTEAPISTDNDIFLQSLLKDEAVSHLSAMNKLRESTIMSMNRDLEKGGDGTRFIKALEAIHQDIMRSQSELRSVLG